MKAKNPARRRRDGAADSALIGGVMTHAAKNVHTLGDADGSSLIGGVITLAAKKFHTLDDAAGSALVL